VAAAIVLTTFHAMSKALLFLSAGTVQKVFERRDIEGSEGLIRRAPGMFGAFMIGMFTMFLVPFGVFIAKYAALTVSVVNPVLIMMLVVGSIGCEVFYIRWLGRTMAVTGEPVKKEVAPLFTAPMWALALGAIIMTGMLPLYYSGLLDHIVGFNRLDVTFPYISLNYTGFIPTALIFIGLLFIVYYAMRDDGGRKVAPYTGGMYEYKVELACPYFEQYTKASRNMLYAELVGVAVMALAFIAALKSGGVF
jgi:NADH:ubiquinone oxidoreductase subunit 5 (subunit L)/multisubunit Na+/H+ antiporter MnhA subunit